MTFRALADNATALYALSDRLDCRRSALEGSVGVAVVSRRGCRCAATSGSIAGIRKRPSFSIPSRSNTEPPCIGVLHVKGLSFHVTESSSHSSAKIGRPRLAERFAIGSLFPSYLDFAVSAVTVGHGIASFVCCAFAHV